MYIFPVFGRKSNLGSSSDGGPTPLRRTEGGARATSGKVSEPSKTRPTSETVGRRAEMMIAIGSPVAAAFSCPSASSLSLPASSVDTFSAVQHLSAPQFMAKSPSLLKASQGFAEATAIRGPKSPCTFTLRGKRQTRGEGDEKLHHNDGNNNNNNNGDDGGRATTANSPRRPPYRVDAGKGYSSRLRMLGEAGNNADCHGGKTTATTAELINEPLSPVLARPVSPASRSLCAVAAAADICTTTNNAAPCCDATAAAAAAAASAVDTTYGPVTSCRVVCHPCRESENPRERDLAVVSAYNINEIAATAWPGSQARTSKVVRGPPNTREHPVAASRAERLCGRLWMGTTASAKSDAARPRTLFLVSGQQQQHTRKKRHSISETKRHHHHQSLRLDPIFVPTPLGTVRNTRPLPPGVRRETTASAAGWRSRSPSCCDVRRIDQDGDNKGRGREASDSMLSPESTGYSGGADGGCSFDAKTTAATDGKGGESAKKVLHVRVPHPPPTSLLILRLAPPAE